MSLQRPPARSRGHGDVNAAHSLEGAASRPLFPLPPPHLPQEASLLSRPAINWG